MVWKVNATLRDLKTAQAASTMYQKKRFTLTVLILSFLQLLFILHYTLQNNQSKDIHQQNNKTVSVSCSVTNPASGIHCNTPECWDHSYRKLIQNENNQHQQISRISRFNFRSVILPGQTVMATYWIWTSFWFQVGFQVYPTIKTNQIKCTKI